MTVAQALASLFSGVPLGLEGAIGNIASKIAAMYCDLFRIPKDQRSKLVFASVASGYNGLLENPAFATVLVAEVAETSAETRVRTLITGAVHALFRTPLMVVLLTARMLNANATLTALIVLAMATVMIAMPPLQRCIAARQAGRGPASAAATDRLTQGE